jgi:diadenosine tetraphosphatase ApaH/serine/threonine PP2A family protein phosphatase
MKIAIISDIHGNLEALEAVLRDIAAEGCARTYCLGDVVGYGPAPNEVCARLRELNIETIQGNHDEAAALDIPLSEALLNPLAYKSLLWTRRVLSRDHRRWLRERPRQIDIPEFKARLCHANPQNPLEWEYVRSRFQAWQILEAQEQLVCFIGHTHRPFVWELLMAGVVTEQRPEIITLDPASRYLMNVGSVGQPRDGDPRCSYAIVDQAAQTVEFRKVPYPVSITQQRMREQSLPDKLAERLTLGM